MMLRDEMIAREAVKFHSECWRERRKALRAPACEKSSLRDKIKQTTTHAAKGDKVDFETCVNLCPMNENETSIHEMRSYVSKFRLFRANTKDAAQQDIRKFRKIR